MQEGFIFDTNKCVGCQACTVACAIENKTMQSLTWREVSTFNVLQHPAIPAFHLSLACNHCKDALCLKNCPALAYTRDPITKAVIHHAERCIGCKFCTWACPYDAPKYNPKKHIVEKCTFCNTRLQNGQKPMCVTNCPTGALNYGKFDDNIENEKVAGFTHAELEPRIKIIPLRSYRQIPDFTVEEVENIPFDSNFGKKASKISLRKEWTLAVFTLLSALLVAQVISVFMSGKLLITPIQYFVAGIAGIVMSSVHLGKKLRAYRAVFNLKNSWLSREIASYTLFLFFSSIYIFSVDSLAFYQQVISFYDIPIKALALISIVIGLFTLFSIDRVYDVTLKRTPNNLHSSSVFLSALFFAAIVLNVWYLWASIGLIKALLYSHRKFYFYETKQQIRSFISSLRMDFMITIPLLMWVFGLNYFWGYFTFVLLGEIVDRFEFYAELEVMTPQKQISIDLKKIKN